MLLKIVSFFLIFIIVLAMFGQLRTAGRWLGIGPRKRQAHLAARRCNSCGAPRVGRGPCACGAED